MARRASSLIVTLALAGLVFPALSAWAGDTLVIPAGSTMRVRLTTTLSTRTSKTGDPWAGKMIDPILFNGEELVPAGSMVEGRVTYVKEAGRIKGVGEMRLVAETITTLDDTRWNIAASLEDAQGAYGAKVSGQEGTIKGPSGKKGDAIGVGVTTGIGAGVGGIAKGGSGALYGAGIGAVAGLIRTAVTRGKGVILPQGSEMTFVISRTTTAQKLPPVSTSTAP